MFSASRSSSEAPGHGPRQLLDRPTVSAFGVESQGINKARNTHCVSSVRTEARDARATVSLADRASPWSQRRTVLHRIPLQIILFLGTKLTISFVLVRSHYAPCSGQRGVRRRRRIRRHIPTPEQRRRHCQRWGTKPAVTNAPSSQGSGRIVVRSVGIGAQRLSPWYIRFIMACFAVHYQVMLIYS